MDNVRIAQLELDGGTLTNEEQMEGWHFCGEFDELLTTGEMFEPDGVTCICGFDRRAIAKAHGEGRR